MKKNRFKEIVAGVLPTAWTDYRHYLKKVYETVREAEGRYSYNRFTADCGLGDSNAMYLLIHSGRPLTVKTARRIATALGLKGKERSYFIRLVEYQHARDPAARDKAFEKLLQLKNQTLAGDWDKKNLELFSEWYHVPVLELLRLDQARDDPDWIAGKLSPRVSRGKVEASLELLENLGLIVWDEERGRMVPAGNNISTGSEIRGMVVKTYHNQMINLALGALSSGAAARRDITAVTIGVPVDAMEEVKKLTAEFRQKLLELGDRPGRKEEVLQINIQAFPLTGVVRRKKESDS